MAHSTNLSKVFALAGQETAAFGLTSVTHQTFLLGMLRDPESDAAQILVHFGITSESLLPVVEQTIGKRRNTNLLSNHPTVRNAEGYWMFSSPLFEAYEQANAHALALNHGETHTSHVLLCLVRDRHLDKTLAALNVNKRKMIDLINSYLTAATAADRSQTLSSNAGTLQPVGAEGDTAGGAKSKSRTPTLDEFGRDLTALARKGKLSPLIGRVQEVARCVRILGRKTKRNPLLIGEPGVGKTTLAEGIAVQIVQGNVPAILRDKRVVELELATLVAGTKYRGEFEERIKNAVKEASAEGVILFIDELHTLVGGGGASGGLDASNILKPALSRGEITVIGATTLTEFRKHFQKDAALERRFQPVRVEPATVEETIEIIKGLRAGLQDHHRVSISDTAIVAAAKLSDRYISDKHLPDKALDLIDEASSALAIAFPAPEEVEMPPVPAPTLLQRILRENPVQRLLLGAPKPVDTPKSAELTAQNIAELVSEMTGIPVGDMERDERDLLLNLEANIGKRVIGQKAAIKAVAEAMRRARAGLRDPNRPAGSFLFLGPTGVGKTEVAKTLQKIRTHDIKDLVRLDMSEYMEKHSVSRIIGAPPGYVGYDEGGILTEAVRRKPYAVVLFDEIEKAHPDVFNILLQVLDDGRLTDGQGRTVDFRNVLIIMTSNAGSEELERESMGFQSQKVEVRVLDAVKKMFRPEFLNRIDELVVFTRLVKEEIEQVVEIMMSDLRERLMSEHSIQLTLEAEAMALVVKHGYDPVYGARPLKRAIQKLVENPLADAIIRGTVVKTGMQLGSRVAGDIIEFFPVNVQAVSAERQVVIH
ncbi:MAG: ATP-dependent Clp protease ATP-binding subunit [Candidatus Melainabacteria bacterium]|nr:ATP-dependent Clp protease ATP-binding subunit [Candidatus Melainabacteria bacterium]